MVSTEIIKKDIRNILILVFIFIIIFSVLVVLDNRYQILTTWSQLVVPLFVSFEPSL